MYLENIETRILQEIAQALSPSDSASFRGCKNEVYSKIRRTDYKFSKDVCEKLIKSGMIEDLQYFWSSKIVDPGAYDNLAIKVASEYGQEAIVKLLLDDGRADPCAGDNWPIIYASMNGHTAIVKLLLADGRADPNNVRNLAMRVAVEYGHLDIVRLFLADDRVDPSANDSYAIIWAIESGKAIVMKELLDDGRAIPQPFAIIQASIRGRADFVKLLLEDGRANSVAVFNQAINVAKQMKHDDVVELLMNYVRLAE